MLLVAGYIVYVTRALIPWCLQQSPHVSMYLLSHDVFIYLLSHVRKGIIL